MGDVIPFRRRPPEPTPHEDIGSSACDFSKIVPGHGHDQDEQAAHAWATPMVEEPGFDFTQFQARLHRD